jgi:DNA-directed RNA polymerase specialized sigma24 family protein
MVYCVVSSDVTPRMQRLVERALRDDEGVRVVVERRVRDRRARGERRAAADARRSRATERRRIRYRAGRRAGERRAGVVPVVPRSLPRRASDGVVFVEALAAPSQLREDVEAVRAIARFQAGEPGALEALYERWFDSLYAYMRVTLDRSADAEEAACAAMIAAAEEAVHVSPEPSRVRAWLFGLAHRVSGAEAAIPAGLAAASSLEDADAAVEDVGLAWLADDELLLFVERRPGIERQVLALRYLAGLGFVDIAAAMAIDLDAAVALHANAVRCLSRTLGDVSRSPRVGGRLDMVRLGHQTPVLHRRRRALLAV